MKALMHWHRQAARAAHALMLALLLSCLPTAAWAMPQEPPPPAPEQADPELVAIVRDIILLRMINQMGMTREQIAAVIPELEAVLRDEQAQRRDVKALFLEQRRALLKGDVPEAELEATRRKIKERTEQFRDQTRRRLEALGQRLTSDQIRHLRRLVLAGPALWRHGPRPAPSMSAREPQQRRGPRPALERPADEEMGPSAQMLERVIALLKEKLEVMVR